jgi:hypothetical protein
MIASSLSHINLGQCERGARFPRMNPNYAPEDTGELGPRLCGELSSLRERPDLLASFIRHAKIPLRM